MSRTTYPFCLTAPKMRLIVLLRPRLLRGRRAAGTVPHFADGIQEHPQSAPHGLPDEGEPRPAGAPDPGALGGDRALPPARRAEPREAPIRPPRRSALREREHPHRPHPE